jgi:hypothetical protein
VATFQVPQFIEKKPKIIGPLTLQQFLFIAGAAFLSFLTYYTFEFFLWAMFSIFIASIAILLAFGKINGQDAPLIIKAIFSFLIKPRIFIWQKIKEADTQKVEESRGLASIQKKLQSIMLSASTGKNTSSSEVQKPEIKKGYQKAVFSTGESRFIKRVDYD